MSERDYLMGSDVVGAGPTLDLNFGLNTFADVGQRVWNTVQESEAKKEAERNAAAKLAEIIKLDEAATAADAELGYAMLTDGASSAKVVAARAVFDEAVSAANAASVGLPPDVVQKRVEAAKKASAAAAKKALDAANKAAAASKDGALAAQAKVTAAGRDAAKRTVIRASGIVLQTTPTVPVVETPNFFERRYADVPVWGWGIGAAALGAILYSLRKVPPGGGR